MVFIYIFRALDYLFVVLEPFFSQHTVPLARRLSLHIPLSVMA